MDIDKLIVDLKTGKLSDKDFKSELLKTQVQDLGDVVLDLQREARCGIPEVVFAQSKTVEQILVAAERLLEKYDRLLITRIEDSKAIEVMERLAEKGCTYEKDAEVIYKLPPVKSEKTVLILTAGTSDIAVGREAELTCRMFGLTTRMKVDVGVAGLHRLLGISEELLAADCIIVCAGMEGALPSVVGGLVKVPVIAAPVSCGYGTAFSGLTAMLGMLNSCASGLTVVNIDNGFGAGYAAGRILAGK